MLAIRLQRTGRHGHAQFRVVVQDSRQAPSSGKFVALLGSYNPHTKTAQVTKDQAELYLKNGAQPSDRVARLFKQEGIKLPSWVEINTKKTGTIRHSDKLRRNRPPEEAKPQEVAEAPEPVAESAEPAEVAKAEEAAAPAEPEAVAEESGQPTETDSTEEQATETSPAEAPEPEQEKEEPKATTEEPAQKPEAEAKA